MKRANLNATAVYDNDRKMLKTTKNIGCREPFDAVMSAVIVRT